MDRWSPKAATTVQREHGGSCVATTCRDEWWRVACIPVPRRGLHMNLWRHAVVTAYVIVFAIAAPRAAAPQLAADLSQAASAAASASPELVGMLSKELGGTTEQAAGAAGALFGVAQSRLKPEEMSQVSKAVPGMDSLLRLAPMLLGGSSGASGGAGGAAGAISQAAGAAAGLPQAAAAFSKLGLKPEMVSRAIPVL